MNLTQADDFLRESETLFQVLLPLTEADFDAVTGFKGWTINDVLVHLYFWNRAADMSAFEPDTFTVLLEKVMAAFAAGKGLRGLENATVSKRGIELRTAWISQARDMAERWRDMDPKKRLAWAGPPMSARSSITARQMETWAHGFEVFDCLGLERSESDRIRNIVVLGVNTFGWSHQVQGLKVPDAMPHLALTAPSGDVWEYGDPAAGEITGPAVDFAAVVTQTRALADTALQVSGPIAQNWMSHAQCFAGPPETPPEAGTRRRNPAFGAND